MFMKGLNYLKDWVICLDYLLKKSIIIDLSKLSELLRFVHTLKEISKTIFLENFPKFCSVTYCAKI